MYFYKIKWSFTLMKIYILQIVSWWCHFIFDYVYVYARAHAFWISRKRVSAKSRNRVSLKDRVLEMKNWVYFKNPLTFLCHWGPKVFMFFPNFSRRNVLKSILEIFCNKAYFWKQNCPCFYTKIGGNFPNIVLESTLNRGLSEISEHVCYIFKGALDNFSLIPNFFSKKLRFLHH